MMRVVIDTELCCGHGRCYQVAPELFSDDERGYGRVNGHGIVSPEQAEAVQSAITGCPEKAISLVEG